VKTFGDEGDVSKASLSDSSSDASLKKVAPSVEKVQELLQAKLKAMTPAEA
jgi:hypothetical protein